MAQQVTDKPDARNTGRPLHAIVFETSAPICREIVEALGPTDCVIDAVQVTSLEELQSALTPTRPDVIIASHTLSEPQLEQLSQWRAGRRQAPAVLLAAHEINPVTYAKALRFADGRLLSLADTDCARLVLACGLPTGGEADAPIGDDLRDAGREGPGSVSDEDACTGSHDLLTGLYSHMYLFDAFDAAVTDPPDRDRFNALLHIKLDRFDGARRQLGEGGSDLVLSEVAEVMRGVIGDQDTAARIRDETFAILVKNRPREAILQCATTLRDRVGDKHFSILGQVFEGTCSIGVCLFGEDNSHLDQVVSKAALACEVAQGEGDGQIHVYDQGTDAGLRTAMESGQEERLRAALAQDRLATVFQPVVNLHASAGDNYEVLLRLRDEHGREVLPGEFMSAAHRANLLPEIDRWVIGHGIRKLIERETKQTRLFIKLDHQTFADTTFLPWLTQQLRDNAMAGDRLVFELSEPVVAGQVEAFQWLLQGLHEVGSACALEHAGRTRHALGLIKRLAVDFIKIDGALTHDLAKNELHQARVKSLVQGAKADGKQVIVPFVEDATSLSLLWRWDVDYVQGNYVQRPEAKLNYVFDEQP